MPDFYADISTIVNGPAFGQPVATRAKANKYGGRLRIAQFTFKAPASGTAPAIADRIIWGELPVNARFIGHLSLLQWSTGTASCTLNLGDSIVAARHLAATAITTAGTAVPNASNFVNAGVGDITNGSTTISNVRSPGSFQPGFLIAGTGIPAGSVIVAVDRQARTVSISSPATATTANLAITTTGGSYETTNESNSIGNNFGGVLDDCTLMSVVAGAQIANNQVITLTAAYTHD